MSKKHKYFPPSLYKVSGAWVTISGLVLAAWAIPYFNQSLHFNFPACLKIIIALFAINLIYLFHLEFNNSQITDDQLEELKAQYKSLKDKYDELSKKCDSIKERNDSLISKCDQLSQKINILKKERDQYNTPTITSKKIIDKLVTTSKNVTTIISDTTTHTITINNKTLEESPKSNESKITEKEH